MSMFRTLISRLHQGDETPIHLSPLYEALRDLVRYVGSEEAIVSEIHDEEIMRLAVLVSAEDRIGLLIECELYRRIVLNAEPLEAIVTALAALDTTGAAEGLATRFPWVRTVAQPLMNQYIEGAPKYLRELLTVLDKVEEPADYMDRATANLLGEHHEIVRRLLAETDQTGRISPSQLGDLVQLIPTQLTWMGYLALHATDQPDHADVKLSDLAALYCYVNDWIKAHRKIPNHVLP